MTAAAQGAAGAPGGAGAGGRPGPLGGVRVLEFAGTQGLYAGKLLADLGADVLLAESPGGHPARREPPLAPGGGSLHFAYYATGRRGVVLDLESEAGRRAAGELAAGADLVLACALDGPSRDRVRRLVGSASPRPALVELTGGAVPGPQEPLPEMVAFASGALMFISGQPQGPPVTAPAQAGWDHAGTHAALAALACLLGGGRPEVHLSVQECLAAAEHTLAIHAREGKVVRRAGAQHQTAVPGRVYPCADGWVHIFITASTPGAWDRLLDWLGRPEALADPRWADGVYRRRHAEEVDRVVIECLRSRTAYELARSAQERHLPCVPGHTVAGFLQDQHVRARGFLARCGPRGWEMPALPYRLSGHPDLRPAAAPDAAADPPPAGGASTLWRARPAAAAGAPSHGARGTEDAGGAEGARGTEGTEDAGGADQPDRPHGAAGPLAGVRVLDFSHMIAGPFATLQYAYLGAEILKVESSHRMDGFRLREGGDPETSRPFGDFNRNKRGLSVDLKRPEARRLALALAARCEMVVENFSPDVMGRLGLGHDDLRAAGADPVMVSVQGMGQSGPNRHWVCWGPSTQWFSGLGYLWNIPGGPLVGSQTSFPDYIAGLHAAVGGLAALYEKRGTRRGQRVEVAMVEATAALLGVPALVYAATGVDPAPAGNGSERLAPHGCYRCRGEDEWLVLAVRDEREWQALRAVPGLEAALADPRFTGVASRRAHREALDAALGAWAAERPAAEAASALRAAGVPAGRVNSGADLDTDPDLASVGFISEIDHPRAGRQRYAGPVYRLDGRRPAVFHAPLLGQDTEAVLRDVLGLSPSEIGALRACGALD